MSYKVISQPGSYKVTSHTVIFNRCYGFYPVVREDFKIDKEYKATFILADTAQVRLIDPPYPKLVGVEGKWGKLKKELYDSPAEAVNFTLEVINEEYYWLCYPFEIINGVNKLREKVSRRNRLIEDLRAKL